MSGQRDGQDARLLAYNRGVERARQAYREGPIDWDRLEADEAEAQKSRGPIGASDQVRGPSPSSSVAFQRDTQSDTQNAPVSRSDRARYGVTHDAERPTSNEAPA